jgi:hypothetical protein
MTDVIGDGQGIFAPDYDWNTDDVNVLGRDERKGRTFDDNIPATITEADLARQAATAKAYRNTLFLDPETGKGPDYDWDSFVAAVGRVFPDYLVQREAQTDRNGDFRVHVSQPNGLGGYNTLHIFRSVSTAVHGWLYQEMDEKAKREQTVKNWAIAAEKRKAEQERLHPEKAALAKVPELEKEIELMREENELMREENERLHGKITVLSQKIDVLVENEERLDVLVKSAAKNRQWWK